MSARIKNRSTISVVDSILNHLFWGIYVSFAYKMLVFIPIDGFTRGESTFICFSLIIASIVLGLVLRWKQYMTKLDGFTDAFAGVGMYSMWAFKDFYLELILGLLVFVYIFSIVYGVRLFCKKRNGHNIFELYVGVPFAYSVKVRLKKTAAVTLTVMGLAMTVLAGSILFNRMSNGGIISASNCFEHNRSLGNGDTAAWEQFNISNNLKRIYKIRYRTTWDSLTINEKLTLLQDISNCEAYNLGLNSTIQIVIADLKDGSYGCYDHYFKRITIDLSHLKNDNPNSILNTVLHEMYHAYENELVELYLGADVSHKRLKAINRCEEYLRELSDYQKGSTEDVEQYMLYYTQVLETDSRAYAKTECEYYYSQIDRYLSGEE